MTKRYSEKYFIQIAKNPQMNQIPKLVGYIARLQTENDSLAITNQEYADILARKNKKISELSGLVAELQSKVAKVEQ